MKTLRLNSIVVRGDEHVETQSGDQTLMMSVEQGKYYSVAATAGRIWELIEHPIAISELIENLTSEYEVDAETCAAQILPFMAELIENGLAVELEGARNN